ncbi:hypothetical protein P280DRAFT_202755 [Massarina eburnea CBS 473.64]|uniref:Lysine-specific metallo-endopeptidase domain-containing protein n=1 Tax=Massarina eburnea CBS 473.64 TaxID=1395130 RepID=A0A6A6RIA8_9PLEO|nr:hypothetical protein P280DRAFT_202755 [Massarina eburnea CBS 473.64]
MSFLSKPLGGALYSVFFFLQLVAVVSAIKIDQKSCTKYKTQLDSAMKEVEAMVQYAEKRAADTTNKRQGSLLQDMLHASNEDDTSVLKKVQATFNEVGKTLKDNTVVIHCDDTHLTKSSATLYNDNSNGRQASVQVLNRADRKANLGACGGIQRGFTYSYFDAKTKKAAGEVIILCSDGPTGALQAANPTKKLGDFRNNNLEVVDQGLDMAGGFLSYMILHELMHVTDANSFPVNPGNSEELYGYEKITGHAAGAAGSASSGPNSITRLANADSWALLAAGWYMNNHKVENGKWKNLPKAERVSAVLKRGIEGRGRKKSKAKTTKVKTTAAEKTTKVVATTKAEATKAPETTKAATTKAPATISKAPVTSATIPASSAIHISSSSKPAVTSSKASSVIVSSKAFSAVVSKASSDASSLASTSKPVSGSASASASKSGSSVLPSGSASVGGTKSASSLPGSVSASSSAISGSVTKSASGTLTGSSASITGSSLSGSASVSGSLSHSASASSESISGSASASSGITASPTPSASEHPSAASSFEGADPPIETGAIENQSSFPDLTDISDLLDSATNLMDSITPLIDTDTNTDSDAQWSDDVTAETPTDETTDDAETPAQSEDDTETVVESEDSSESEDGDTENPTTPEGEEETEGASSDGAVPLSGTNATIPSILPSGTGFATLPGPTGFTTVVRRH